MTLFDLSPAFIERLGWVLLHSLWQFALIALIAMVLERAMRRFSARIRYGALLMAFGAMAVAPAATWLVIPNESTLAEAPEVSIETGGRPTQLDEPAPLNAIIPVSEPMAVASKKPAPSPMPIDTTQPEEQVPVSPAGSDIPFWKSMEQGLRPWLAYLVIGWCLGVCVFALRPILSWRRVRRLRTVGVSAPPEAVQQLLESTAKRLHLRQAVQILQSTLVHTAVVVGYFRPVILLPMSAITGLSAAQLEAILAHELAHIRRHDYLVNVLQTLIETVFFYHPAIWWLSNQIRTERENCCDDIAVAMFGDRVEYGRALLALEECRGGETALAMGAQGGSLLARVRRLFGSVPPGRAFSGGTILGLGVLAAAAIAVGVWAASGLGESDSDALAQEPDQVKKEGIIVKAPGSGTLDVALSPDGKMLARAGDDDGTPAGFTVDLWDVASGKKLHKLKGYAFKVAFSPDGKTLASITGGWGPPAAAGPDGDGPGEVKLWDVATGKERWSVKGHRSRVWHMAFSADGKTLATASETVKLWDVATGKEKMELGVSGSLAFSPDGKTLAIGGDGVQLWDLTTGKKRASMPGHGIVDLFSSLAFTPDGKTLVSAGLRSPNEKEEEAPNRMTKAAGSFEGYFCQLKLFDVATAKERTTIPISGNFSLPFFPLVFTADSRTLMTARWISDQEGKKVRVSVQHWDLATGKEVATFWTPVNPGGNHRNAGHVAGVRFAALSADGKIVAWGGAEGKDDNITGTAHVWEVGSLATKVPEEPKKSDPAETKKPSEDKKQRMVTLGVLALISAKTEGMSEGAKIKQIDVPKESIGKRDISKAHVTKGRASGRDGADQPRLNGTWVVKKCTITLADGKVLENREVLFGIDFPPQALKRLRFVETVQAENDQGVGAWYAYDAADMQIPAGAPGADDEMSELEGTWTPVAIESGGKRLEGEELEALRTTDEKLLGQLTRFTIKKEGQVGRTWWSRTRMDKDRTYLEYVDVDPTRKPKLMWCETMDGPAKGSVSFSIYELDGDTLKVCFNAAVKPGEEAPAAFNSKGTNTIIVFKRERKPADDAKDNADAWTPLFNGKDLTGWVVEGDNPEAWRVEGDEIVVDAARGGRRYSWLLTKKTYSEFVLRFEYQLSEKATSGAGLWATRYEKVHPEGPNHLQVKLMDDPKYPDTRWPTGAVFWNTDGGSHIGPDRNAKLEPVGSWNRMEVEARANAVRITVNGQEVHSFEPDKLADEAGAYAGLKRRTGHVGFGKGVGVARFRKIEIKELTPVSGPPEKKQEPPFKAAPKNDTGAKESNPKATPDGWVSLFNGKDLAGWKTHPAVPGDWRVEDGILIGRGPKVSHLYTERNDYEDLHFRIEAKINAGGNSGQCFRKQFSAKVGGDGYEAQIDSSSHKAKTGSLYVHLGPAVAIEEVLVPVDTWFTQEVIVRGNHIVILVNGRKTVDFIDKNNNYARGHLALQVYDPGTVVQFRKVEVKELKPATT